MKWLPQTIYQRKLGVIKGPSSTLTLNEVMEETERHTIINYLEVMNGNKSKTAKALGISRTTLYEKMKKYGL